MASQITDVMSLEQQQQQQDVNTQFIIRDTWN